MQIYVYLFHFGVLRKQISSLELLDGDVYRKIETESGWVEHHD